MSPNFLNADEVPQVHERTISQHGDEYGIRDLDLLLSALAQSEATFDEDYLHKDLYSMAAAYLFHIAKNHPFIDGNKRVGTVACLVFLRTNEIPAKYAKQEFVSLVHRVVENEMDKNELAAWLKTENEE